jgi:hypothetical protein
VVGATCMMCESYESLSQETERVNNVKKRIRSKLVLCELHTEVGAELQA